MAKNPKAIGKQSVNLSTNKTRHILIAAGHGLSLDKVTGASGNQVTDVDNDIAFSATLVGTPSPARLVLKLISQFLPGVAKPLDAPAPTDGLLSITLTTSDGSNPPPVSDVPVDYVADPQAP